MITGIRLLFGAGSDNPLDFEPGAATVFVGPDNSGKSLVLRELNAALFDLPNLQLSSFGIPFLAPDKRRTVREVRVPTQEWPDLRPYFDKVDATGKTYIGSLLSDTPPHPAIGSFSPVEFKSQIENQSRRDLIEQARIRLRSAQVAMPDGQRRLNVSV